MEKAIKTMNFLCAHIFNHECFRSYLEEIDPRYGDLLSCHLQSRTFWNQRPQIQFARPPVIHKIIFPYGYDKTSAHIELETAGDKHKLCWFVQGNADATWTPGWANGDWKSLFPLLNSLGFNALLDCKEVCNRFGGKEVTILWWFPSLEVGGGIQRRVHTTGSHEPGTGRGSLLPQARYVESGTCRPE